MRSLHFTVVIVTALLLLASCHQHDFTQRKYLPWFSGSSGSSGHTPVTPIKEIVATITTETTDIPCADVQSATGLDSASPMIASSPETNLPCYTAQLPEDTIVKTQKQLRREARRTDAARAGIALYFAITSITNAILFGLLGLLLWKKGGNLTNEILGLMLLILLILPLYFAAGAASLFGAIVGIVFARKVQTKNAGKDFPEKRMTRTAIILSLFGAILLTIAAIITLPHFLDW